MFSPYLRWKLYLWNVVLAVRSSILRGSHIPTWTAWVALFSPEKGVGGTAPNHTKISIKHGFAFDFNGCLPPHFIIFIKSHHNLIVVFPFSSENKPKNGGICVANHTSPIDVIILASDGCYAMVTILFPGTKCRKEQNIYVGHFFYCRYLLEWQHSQK